MVSIELKVCVAVCVSLQSIVRLCKVNTTKVTFAGIPGLIPQLHKTFVEKQVVNMGSNALNFKVIFSNVTVTGMATAKYNKITWVIVAQVMSIVINARYCFRGFKRDPKTMSNFIVTGTVPVVSIKGHYEGLGKLLLVPVTGKGEAEIQYCKQTWSHFLFLCLWVMHRTIISR